MSVKQNLENIQKKITAACKGCHRPETEVVLLAVSKTKPIEEIQQAYNCGQRHFGENYAQEFSEKWNMFHPEGLQWHFIGSLQRNKVKFVVGKCFLIHSVDRVDLAETISKQAESQNFVQDILLQVHIGDEETKNGILPSELLHIFQQVSSFQGIRVVGLMCMPPLTDNESVARGYFRELKELQIQILNWIQAHDLQIQHPLNQLSMGTTHDFEWAIQEGATIVRVGTAIFGSRK
jgi:PLP dependent protein